MVSLHSALVQEYENLYETLNIKAEKINEVDRIIDEMLEHKSQYKMVERATNVPWFVTGGIHSLESSLNFNNHLHNGDPLTGKTIHVPAGRILGKDPPYSWEESAIDALEYDGVANWTDWSIAGICYRFEKYNGFGYRDYHPSVKSPYLWSFSDHYTKGKYAADGHFDPNLVSQQCGAMVLLNRMEQRGLISFESSIPTHQPVTWLELYRQEVDGSVFPVLAAWATSELVESVELKNRSVEELIGFFGKYPTAKTFHVAASSKPVPPPKSGIVIPPSTTLPTLTRILRWGDKGEEVKALQRILNYLGFDAGAVDGDLGDQTERAVKAFQLRAGLLVDGEVGPITWQALGGKFNESSAVIDSDPPYLKLAAFASQEAAKNLRWNGVASEAEKYLAPLRPIMQRLGHIGTAPVFYNWCAAFVTYCCRQVGIAIPDQPDGFWASMALVASWEYWAKQKGYWQPAGTTKPKRGDIITFDWAHREGRFDHIGIVRGYTPSSSMFASAEGNADNRTAHKSPYLSSISGIIRIR